MKEKESNEKSRTQDEDKRLIVKREINRELRRWLITDECVCVRTRQSKMWVDRRLRVEDKKRLDGMR